MLAVNPTGGWALQLSALPPLEPSQSPPPPAGAAPLTERQQSEVDDIVTTTWLPPFSRTSRMPAGPAGDHLTGVSGTQPILVALPDPGEAGRDVINGAGIVKDLTLHRVELAGLPTAGMLELRFVQWAPKGGGFAFVGRTLERMRAPGPYELWHADWAHTGKRSCKCRKLLPGRCINAALGPPFRWSANGQQLLVKLVPDHMVSATCISASSEEVVHEHYSTCTVVLVDLSTGTELTIGPTEGRPLMYRGWVGLLPSDATDHDPGFAITEPVSDYPISVSESAISKGQQFVILTTATADVEVWRVSTPNIPGEYEGTLGPPIVGVLWTTIRGAVVEAMLPGWRMLLRGVDLQGIVKGVGHGDTTLRQSQPRHFIRLLGLPDAALDATIELQSVFSRI